MHHETLLHPYTHRQRALIAKAIRSAHCTIGTTSRMYSGRFVIFMFATIKMVGIDLILERQR